MADITMCNISDCKLSKTCYRFNAEASEYRQSYFANDPRKEDGSCKQYWEISDIELLNKIWED